MKKIFLFLSYILILSCSSNLVFQIPPPEGYKTIVNDEIGYEFSVPKRLLVIPQSLVHNETKRVINAIEIKEENSEELYFSDGAIRIFSAQYLFDHFDLKQNNNNDLIDLVIKEIDKNDKEISNHNILTSYKNFEYINQESKKIGFFRHKFLTETVKSNVMYSDIFSVYYIFNPSERDSFYVRCAVQTYSVEGKSIEKHSDEILDECKKIIQSSKPL
ncbi:MAG: hypothetical protein CL780_01570 [Chloroflexi bacterium]|nr:hypothetical protein [Chloroflexota bacterium]|tara:strand:+ start:552 stop:1202 length:651 start_codon:yes stop_codon:yes gene_type:complete